ncbi:metal-dependent hydrolase [Halosegnis longus]|uniref:metal-dependent hydrolase n=1 Tax=Halosegnis longus TaxID=2216012 RepID=UPI00096A881F
MWPWAHAALGYLLYRVYLYLRDGTTPSEAAAILLGVGTQLPDLIDKTFAWYIPVLPYGRSFAHSLVVGLPLVMLPIVVWLHYRGAHTARTAFIIGYLSHLVGDGYVAALNGDWAGLGYLAWPLVPAPVEETQGIIAQLAALNVAPTFIANSLLAVVMIGIWVRDGTPGLQTLRRFVWKVASSAK